MESKKICVIQSPLDTFSGYGARSRDFIKSLISLKKDEWDISLISTPWGKTSLGFLNPNKKDEKDMLDRIISTLPKEIDVFIQITIPNEFTPKGKTNIGVTAGIETTACAASWLEGCNRMSHIIVPSKHAKDVFTNTEYSITDKNTQTTSILKLTKPVFVLFEGVDVSVYKKSSLFSNIELNKKLSSIEEEFAYLFVGHWLPGEFGEDRKNVSYTIKAFLETFKDNLNAPALILKTQHSTASILDRDVILQRIDNIIKTVRYNKSIPNIYLINGDLEDYEINELYNHPKVKCMISFTKGEGFGRPLLEFAAVGKPIICSGWSGHIDFLDPNFSLLVSGTLEKVHPSTANEMILAEAKWLKVNDEQVGRSLVHMFTNYKHWKKQAEIYSKTIHHEFSLNKMTQKLKHLI